MEKARVLVVDDDAAMVETLADILSEEGFEVEVARDGAAAVEAVRRTPFDAVLMDIRMPGLDGAGALRAVLALRPGTRVLMMTAYSTDARVEESLRSGASCVVRKPLDLPRVLALLPDRGGAG